MSKPLRHLPLCCFKLMYDSPYAELNESISRTLASYMRMLQEDKFLSTNDVQYIVTELNAWVEKMMAWHVQFDSMIEPGHHLEFSLVASYPAFVISAQLAIVAPLVPLPLPPINEAEPALHETLAGLGI